MITIYTIQIIDTCARSCAVPRPNNIRERWGRCVRIAFRYFFSRIILLRGYENYCSHFILIYIYIALVIKIKIIIMRPEYTHRIRWYYMGSGREPFRNRRRIFMLKFQSTISKLTFFEWIKQTGHRTLPSVMKYIIMCVQYGCILRVYITRV